MWQVICLSDVAANRQFWPAGKNFLAIWLTVSPTILKDWLTGKSDKFNLQAFFNSQQVIDNLQTQNPGHTESVPCDIFIQANIYLSICLVKNNKK